MIEQTTTNAGNIGDNPEYCASRLPCGVCRLLNAMCPKWAYTITPTWAITTSTGTGVTYTVKTGQMKGETDG